MPENERSELVLPANFSDGGVLEATRRFQVASCAFIIPARSPTRGSGLGAVVDMLMLGVDVAQAATASRTIARKRMSDPYERAVEVVTDAGTVRRPAFSACDRSRWFDQRRYRTRTCRRLLPRRRPLRTAR